MRLFLGRSLGSRFELCDLSLDNWRSHQPTNSRDAADMQGGQSKDAETMKAEAGIRRLEIFLDGTRGRSRSDEETPFGPGGQGIPVRFHF